MDEKKGMFYGWWIVLAGTLCLFIAYGARFYSFGIFFKPMASELHWSRTMTAGAMTLSTILYGLASPMIGKLVDKYGAKIVILTGALIGGLGFILINFTENLLHFYIFYSVIMTIGISMTALVPTNAVVAKWFTKKRALAMGIVAMGIGLGGFVMTNVAQMLISTYGWRMSFVILGFIVWLTVIPVVALLMKNSPQDMGLLPDGAAAASNPEAAQKATQTANPGPQTSTGTWTLKSAASTSTFWLMSLSFFAWSFALMIIIIHLVPHATDVGLPKATAAFALALMTLVSIPGRPLGGYFGDKVDIRYLLIGAMAIQMVAMAIFLLFTGVQQAWLLYTFVAVYGAAMGMITPLVPALTARLFGPLSFGVVFGGILLLGTFGSGTGPLIAGRIFDVTKSYSGAFSLGIAMIVIAMLALFFVKPPQPKKTL